MLASQQCSHHFWWKNWSGHAPSLHCLIPGCSRIFKIPGWLVRHIQSNNSGLAVPVHLKKLPFTVAAVVVPTPLPTPLQWGGQNWYREALRWGTHNPPSPMVGLDPKGTGGVNPVYAPCHEEHSQKVLGLDYPEHQNREELWDYQFFCFP